MALSGTLDSFALPDVLRLLASTHKTGRLRVTGDRGSGSVWVDDGEIVSTQLSSPVSVDPTPADVVFGLLRFESGSFTFEADARPANSSEPEQLEPVLVTAEHMLIEWRAIEEVVPSLDVWVTLAPEPTGGDVMMDALRWRCIAAVAGGRTADQVAAMLGQNELEACRTIKELVELGLLAVSETLPETEATAAAPVADVKTDLDDAELDDAGIDHAGFDHAGFDDPGTDHVGIDIESELTADHHAPGTGTDGADDGEAPAAADPGSDRGPDSEPESDELDRIRGTEPLITTTPGLAGLDAGRDPGTDALGDPLTGRSVEPPSGNGPAAESGIGAGPEPFGGLGGDAPVDTPATGGPAEPALADPSDMFGAATASEEASSDLDPAEMARQLANLSPKAAKAVAAAAKASTEAEREAALAAVEAEDDTVNRGLLLKFLGSVEG